MNLPGTDPKVHVLNLSYHYEPSRFYLVNKWMKSYEETHIHNIFLYLVNSEENTVIKRYLINDEVEVK